MCLEQNADLIDEVEINLDEADQAAALSDARHTAEEVFGRARRRIHALFEESSCDRAPYG